MSSQLNSGTTTRMLGAFSMMPLSMEISGRFLYTTASFRAKAGLLGLRSPAFSKARASTGRWAWNCSQR